MKKLTLFAVLLGLMLPFFVQAKALVLVHGFLSSAQHWKYSGVQSELEDQGWREASLSIATPFGIEFLQDEALLKSEKTLHLVQLPSQAPLGVQAEWLAAALDQIHASLANQDITLVGHSAGGVVARLALLHQADKWRVERLITIASPHLGTPRAIQAANITHLPGPMNWAADQFAPSPYRELHQSRWLMHELGTAPGSILNWLNAQPHPDIEYISIIHGDTYLDTDWVVPSISQNLNHIPAIEGKAKSYHLPAAHGLNIGDAQLLIQILSEI